MNPNFQVYVKILKFALIYRNEEGTDLVLTVLQDWCFFMHHILQNMPSLTNFLTDKTSTFKYKCNTIVKQHYLELWTKQAHSHKEGKLRTYLRIKTNFGYVLHLYLKVDVLSVKKLVKLGIFCKICFTEPYHDGCLPSYKFLLHLYAALRSGKKILSREEGCPN
jgi:hypothetical protein